MRAAPRPLPPTPVERLRAAVLALPAATLAARLGAHPALDLAYKTQELLPEVALIELYGRILETTESD